eukprot:17413-Heterococcus_DN1.PRE.1
MSCKAQPLSHVHALSSHLVCTRVLAAVVNACCTTAAQGSSSLACVVVFALWGSQAGAIHSSSAHSASHKESTSVRQTTSAVLQSLHVHTTFIDVYDNWKISTKVVCTFSKLWLSVVYTPCRNHFSAQDHFY